MPINGNPVIKHTDYSSARQGTPSSGYTLFPDEVAQMLDITIEKVRMLFEYSKLAPKGTGPLELVSNGRMGPSATLESVMAYRAKSRRTRKAA